MLARVHFDEITKNMLCWSIGLMKRVSGTRWEDGCRDEERAGPCEVRGRFLQANFTWAGSDKWASAGCTWGREQDTCNIIAT
jgi:hypothetical protein